MELLMITATSVALLLVPVLIEHTIINTTRSIPGYELIVVCNSNVHHVYQVHVTTNTTGY